MSKICAICGKRPVAGRTIVRRGLAKKKGGVGLKITGVTGRRFVPNLKRVRTIIDGTPTKILVCVKCLKAGKVVKAGKAVSPVRKPAISNGVKAI